MRNLLEIKDVISKAGNTESLKIKKVIPEEGNTEFYGRFKVVLPCNDTCFVIADNDVFGKGWEHVSVSLNYRCLTWEEMCLIKDLFFYGDEEAMQIHPKDENYINIHQYCLHIWRPKNVKIPLPPLGLVAGLPHIPDELFKKQRR